MARTPKPGPGKQEKTSVPGISKRTGADGKVYYLVRVYNPDKGPNGGRDNFNTPSWDEAVRIKRREDEKRAQRSKTRGVETVEEWAKRWLVVHRMARNGRPRKDSTVAGYTEAIRPFVRDFGPRKLGDVTPEEARLWTSGGPAPASLAKVAATWRGSTREDGTVIVQQHRTNIQALSAFYNDAIDSSVTDANPFHGIRRTSRGVRQYENEFLTPEELGRLVEIAGQVHGLHGEFVIGPMILFAAYTGLRPGELYGLYPEDIDLEAEDVHVRRAYNGKTKRIEKPKSGKGRVVPLLPEARGALDVLLRGRGLESLAPGEPIWRTARGSALTQRNLHYYWDKVRGAFEAQLPESHWLRMRIREHGQHGNLDFYELRHFFGSRLAELSATPYDIADAMGHQDGGKLAMKVYIKTRTTDARDRIRALAKGRAA